MESLLLFLGVEEARGSDGGESLLASSLLRHHQQKDCLLISPPTNEVSVTMVPKVASPHPGMSPHFPSFHYSTLHHLTSRVLWDGYKKWHIRHLKYSILGVQPRLFPGVDRTFPSHNYKNAQLMQNLLVWVFWPQLHRTEVGSITLQLPGSKPANSLSVSSIRNCSFICF